MNTADTHTLDQQRLLKSVTAIAIAAGQSILQVYHQSGAIEVEVKSDQSPLTAADRQANAVIMEGLRALAPALPVLSEETRAAEYSERRHWRRYWLVDPLDGTREFIKRNGEFTVNIALIEAGRPVLGVVHVPVTGVTYCGADTEGAFVTAADGVRQPIAVSALPATAQTLRVVASRSHRDVRLDRVLEHLQQTFSGVDEVSMGSSLKICLLAEGRADFYPRLAPTSEWDTAAAHAVLAAAGGEIVDTDFSPLRYNQKEALLNPDFLALGDPGYSWQRVLEGCLES
jgi:3'(2'), 5'-bisphosphate nucleotidase